MLSQDRLAPELVPKAARSSLSRKAAGYPVWQQTGLLPKQETDDFSLKQEMVKRTQPQTLQASLCTSLNTHECFALAIKQKNLLSQDIQANPLPTDPSRKPPLSHQ